MCVCVCDRGNIDKFNSDPKISIFLISLKAGGVALNLTAASHVFIMDGAFLLS